MQITGLMAMLDLGGIKKNIGEIEERIVNERREKNRRQQQVVFLLDRIETHFQKQQEELNSAHQKIERLESALQEVASAVERLAGHSKHQSEEHDEVLERVLDLDRKFHTKPDFATQGGPRGVSGEASSHAGMQPVSTEHTAVHKSGSADRRTDDRPADDRPAAGRAAGASVGGDTDGAAAGSPYADPDYAELGALGPRPERPAAARQGAERAAERSYFDRKASERQTADSAQEDAGRAGAEEGATGKRAVVERPARPDFSPDIRAIKALLNRDSSDRAGRESA